MKIANKLLSLLLVAALAVTCFVPVSAADAVWTLTDGVLTVEGEMPDYNAPEQAPWYAERENITSVVLESATKIGSNAFFGCTNLNQVTMSGIVTTIGSSAFYGCSSLTAIDLSGVTAIGSHAFHGSGLTSVELPAGLKSVEAGVFYQCPLEYVAFTGDAMNIDDSAFVDVEATVYYPEQSTTWTAELQQNYGGTLTWTSYKHSVDLYEGGSLVGTYYDFAAAVDACGAGQYLKLTESIEAEFALSKDLYIDLAGNDLTGVVSTNGYKIHGMDSTTDRYTCDKIGYFNCTDAEAEIVPVKHFQASADMLGAVRRYMAVSSEEGWSFHRFYIGITKMSLKPGVTGVGYKARFGADEMVLNELDETEAFGYALWLTESSKITRYKPVTDFVTGREVTLRLQNFDVANFGETEVYADVRLKLADGTVIDSADYSYTLRSMVETVAAALEDYQTSQIKAIKKMCDDNAAAMAKWSIDPIRNWEEQTA